MTERNRKTPRPADSASLDLPQPSEALLKAAIALLDGERRPSISYLQRHLRLGYRAALGLRLSLEAHGYAEVQGIMSGNTQGDLKP